MKKLFALWLMALLLVVFAGSSVVAEEDPFLDGRMDPGTPTIDDGSEEDDHPWGGDQAPADDPGEPSFRPSRLIMTTGIQPVDQLISLFVLAVNADPFEPKRISPVSSTRISAPRSVRQSYGVRSSRSFDKARRAIR
ncbi:MAG: hypothetical protein GY867_06820 [bacterium]|nr:hypothetical protein [bacterium]